MGCPRPIRILAAPFAALLAASVPAQAATMVLRQNEAEARAIVAAERWLGSEQTDERLLGDAVRAMLDADSFGPRWIGAELPRALESKQVPRSKGMIGLATHFTLQFVDRQAGCGIVFAGQYAPLQALQPFSGDLLFQLLLQTPAWFPDTHRIRLVPALRDLQPKAPEEGRLAAVEALARDTATEAEPLREALACMLWQWGHKELAQAAIARLQQDTAEGDVDDRVRGLQQLAALQYQLREYKAAAATQRGVLKLAESTKFVLRPNDYYSAACVFALSGDVERGIAALQHCADLQADPNTDSSLRLARNLPEKDPEIALLRRDPRFAAIFARMFPAESRSGSGAR